MTSLVDVNMYRFPPLLPTGPILMDETDGSDAPQRCARAGTKVTSVERHCRDSTGNQQIMKGTKSYFILRLGEH